MKTSSPHLEDEPTSWIGASISPRGIGLALAFVIAVVLSCGALANWAIYRVVPDPEHPVADLLKRFDLGHEPSIPAFYSASMMLCCAFVLAMIGRTAEHGRRQWYLLSVGMFAMALDEAVMFHEMVDTAIKTVVDTSGVFYFAWVMPAMALIAILGLTFARFLMALDRKTTRYFVTAGGLYVLGAVGMEMFAGLIFDASKSEEEAVKSMLHIVSQTIEEGLEMVGIGIFFVGLVDFISRNHRGFRFPVAQD